MRKYWIIFAEFLLIAWAVGMLFISGAIFDVGSRVTTLPYFFQPNAFSFERIGRPMTPSEFGTDRIRNMLLRRFVREYMYVIPNVENVTERMKYQKYNPFARMSLDKTFKYWVENVAPEIKEMAAAGELRIVRFRDDGTDTDITYDEPSGYWAVEFDTYTWTRPNDFNTEPIKDSHTMYLRFNFSMKTSPSILAEGIHNYLDNGGDPADLFRIGVEEVVLK